MEENQDLLEKCIKLVQANKITYKNAWEYEDIIDNIEQIVDINDFIQSSNTITVAQTIYSKKVDGLQKFVDQIYLKTGVKNAQNLQDDDEDEESEDKKKQIRKSRVNNKQSTQFNESPEKLTLQPQTQFKNIKIQNYAENLAYLYSQVLNSQDYYELPVNTWNNYSFLPDIQLQFNLAEVETQQQINNENSFILEQKELLARSQFINQQMSVDQNCSFIQNQQQDVILQSFLEQDQTTQEDVNNLVEMSMISITEDNVEEQQVQQVEQLVKPKGLPRMKRNIQQSQFDWFKQQSIQYIQPEKVKKIQTKLPEIKEQKVNQQIKIAPYIIPQDDKFKLLLSDYQTSFQSQINSDINFSVIKSQQGSLIEKQVVFNEDSDVEQGDNQQNIIQEQIPTLLSNTVIKEHPQIQFSKKQVLINIQELKKIISHEIDTNNINSFEQINQLYPNLHNNKVTKNQEDVTLLHLANEKSLNLENVNGDIIITK